MKTPGPGRPLSLSIRTLGHLSITARILAVGLLSLVVLMVTTLLTVRQVATDVVMEQYWSNARNVMLLVERDLLSHGNPALVDGKLRFGEWDPTADPAYFDPFIEKIGFDVALTQLQDGKLVRIATTVKTPDGKRNVGPAFTSDLADVLLRGDQIQALSEVAGTVRSGSYLPIKDGSGKVVSAFVVGKPVDVVTAVSDRIIKVVMLVSAAGLLVSVGLLWLVVRPIRRAIRQVTAAAHGLAEGDLAQRLDVHSDDELGEMASSIRAIVTYQREIGDVAEAVATGDLRQNVEPKGAQDALGTAIHEMVTSLRELVGEVQSSATEVAGTSQQLGLVAGQASEAVQQVAIGVQEIASGAGEAGSTSQIANETVEELRQAIEQVARGAQEQAHAVSEATATATEMAAGVEQVAASAQSVAVTSQQTRDSAAHGAQAVRQTVSGMDEIQQVVSQAAGKIEELGRLGEKIGAVVETIDDIAEQTNLLALNAAIEAARAGEHGRGFAVVADEVRKLAERSQRETKSISELIRDVQNGTRDAVQAMQEGAQRVAGGSTQAREAGTALDEIQQAVEATVRQVVEIAASAQAMAQRSHVVRETMTSISASVDEASSASEEMAGSADSVGKAVASIAALATGSSAATEEVSASAEEMSAQVEEMTAQAHELASAAERLNSLVARFQVADTGAERDALPGSVVPARRASDWAGQDRRKRHAS